MASTTPWAELKRLAALDKDALKAEGWGEESSDLYLRLAQTRQYEGDGREVAGRFDDELKHKHPQDQLRKADPKIYGFLEAIGGKIIPHGSQGRAVYSGGEDLAQGVPGALTNTPPGAAASPVQQNDDQQEGENTEDDDTTKRLNHEDVINYEVDRNITHVQHERGQVERLSVAVVVDYRDGVNEDGEAAPVPLSDDQLERINQLARQAMGFSVERGDGLEVVNSPFTQVESEDQQRAWWQDPFWQDFLFSMGRWLLVGLAALLLFLLVLRPMLKRYARQAPAPAARPAQAQAPSPAPAAADEAGDEPEPVAPRRRRRRSSAYEQNRQDLQDMAQEDPAMVAMIVRNWMNRND